MIVQLAITIIFLFLAYFYSRNNKINPSSDNIRKKFLIIACTLLALQSGFRHLGVGPDTYTYFKDFESIKLNSWNDLLNQFVNVYSYGIGKDPGYPILVKSFQLFSSEYRIFLFFVSITFFLALGRFLYYNTYYLRDIVFALILYQVLFASYLPNSAIRQSIALALVLFSFEYIKKHKLIPFLLLIAIAMFIHKSVLIFLPFYIFANINKAKFIFISSILLFPISIYLRGELADILILVSQSDTYVNYTAAENFSSPPITFTFLLIFISIICLLTINKTLKLYPESFRFFNAFAIAIIFASLVWVNPNLMRVVSYFSIFLTVLIPCSFNSYSIKTRNIFFVLSIFALVLIMLKQNEPYKFLWQNMVLLYDF